MERKHESRTSKKTEQERFAEIGRGQAYLMHEMRRPLVTIGLLARFWRKRSDLKQKDGETLDTIIELVNSGEKLLKECLYFIGPMNEEKKTVNVESLLKGIRRTLLPKANPNGIAIEVGHVSGYQPLVSCARRRLRQAVLNVAENSLEAMAGNGGCLTFTGYEAPERVVIKIKDTGPGINPEVKDEMFRPFVSTKKGGSGLGLALAKKIVEDHDGKLSVRSKPGRGTSVTIRLPKLTS